MCEYLVKYYKFQASTLLGEKSVIFIVELYGRMATPLEVNKRWYITTRTLLTQRLGFFTYFETFHFAYI